MSRRPGRFTKWVILLAILLGIGLLGWVASCGRRPPRRDDALDLFPGVSYTRRALSTPRRLMAHVVEIDLSAPHVRFLVTPGDGSRGLELPARTTSRFAAEFGVQVAINGSFFVPFRVGQFLVDYYPHNGDPVDILGLAVSDGDVYSPATAGRPVLCMGDGGVEIRPSRCPAETQQALAGNHVLVWDGRSVVASASLTLHPRTAVALDKSGETMWLVIVDGRQPGYSEGVTLAELARLIVELGADTAVNLDGGGSSTLVAEIDGQMRLLNAPVHKRVPMWQRPVGNHLGVFVGERAVALSGRQRGAFQHE